MDHSAHHETPSTNAPAAGIWAVLILSFSPCLLTLLWVIHLASAGR